MSNRIQNWVKALSIMCFALTLTAFSGETNIAKLPGTEITWGNERAGSQSNDEESAYGYLLPRQETVVTATPTPTPTPKPPPQLMMSVASRSGNQRTIWNTCDRRAVIRAAKGYGTAKRDVPCVNQEPEQIHPMLVRYMEAYMLTCSQRAAQTAGFPQPVKLFLNISGAYVNRPIAGTNRLSQHAYGRALDIYDMSLIDAQGRRTWVDTNVRGHRDQKNRTFFNAFRRCWAAKLGCDEVNGSIGHIHSDGHSNHAHNDHLHIQASSGCRGPR